LSALEETTADEGSTSAARLQAAAALRELGNAMVDRQVDDELLLEIASAAKALLPRMASAPQRGHSFFDRSPEFVGIPTTSASGAVDNVVFPDCFVSGMANPMGMGARLSVTEEGATLEVELGAAFEGAPGRAHGGAVAALIDEVMGFAQSAAGTVSFTGRLTLSYRAPTPVGQPLRADAWVAERNGRKLTLKAELRSEDTLLVEAEALFIVVDPSRFLGQA
jgi:acyl-coenzyme A thioesterase PaaI-like protein